MRTQVVNQFQGIRSQGFVFDEAKDVNSCVKLWQQPARFQQFEQHNIAHAKAKRGQIDCSSAVGSPFSTNAVTSSIEKLSALSFSVVTSGFSRSSLSMI